MSERQPDRPQITAAENGPLIVKHLTSLDGVGGESIECKPVMALCRCGLSQKRPFCDGSHAPGGFVDANEGGKERDERKSYAGEQVTIHDNRGICSHAAICTEELASVFDHTGQPWIHPDKADVAEIVRICEACPSGALSYTIDGNEHQDYKDASGIQIERHGPYRVQGRVVFEDAPWFAEVSREHYALCRCGHSKNKPFCDGAHWRARYRDDDKIRVATLEELQQQSPLEVEILGVTVTANLESGEPRVTTSDGRALATEVEAPWSEVLVSRTQLRGED